VADLEAQVRTGAFTRTRQREVAPPFLLLHSLPNNAAAAVLDRDIVPVPASEITGLTEPDPGVFGCSLQSGLRFSHSCQGPEVKVPQVQQAVRPGVFMSVKAMQFLRSSLCTTEYLYGKQATLICVSVDICILTYKKARSSQRHLAGEYLSFCVYGLWY
jgi:hypothetical protein